MQDEKTVDSTADSLVVDAASSAASDAPAVTPESEFVPASDSSESATTPASEPPVPDAKQFQLPVNLPPNSPVIEAKNYFADVLKDLHSALQEIAPVYGISGSGTDIRAYRVDLAPDATSEQAAAVSAFLARWPVLYARQLEEKAERQALEDWFNGAIAAGFTAPTGLKLGLTSDVVTLVMGNYIMAQSAAQMGLPITLLDANGVMHFFNNIEALTELMLAYGQYRASISADYATRKANIDAKYAEKSPSENNQADNSSSSATAEQV